MLFSGYICIYIVLKAHRNEGAVCNQHPRCCIVYLDSGEMMFRRVVWAGKSRGMTRKSASARTPFAKRTRQWTLLHFYTTLFLLGIYFVCLHYRAHMPKVTEKIHFKALLNLFIALL